MKKLGMNALLGVGQGSEHDSRMVIMRWNGGKRDDKPIAFIGKGVCFDTGGISIKPAAGMEDMKGDMAGAACVVGLMQALAARKAKVNAVGAIGLVENAVDGKAQRPGDIVTTMSGQTIEIINTDAEGRLVLADVLHYVNKRFKPKFMIDLATLTGAIIVALGQEYAGLFSNDDKLAERLAKAGEATGERVWRMPLGPEYDKMIDSKFADMKNTGGRYGGSITAAQLLARFVDKTPWVHLDIAGTAHGLAADRHQQELGLGLRRAAARPARVGILRAVRARSLAVRVERASGQFIDDRASLLSSATSAARKGASDAARTIARSRLAGRRAGRLGRAGRGARCAFVDLPRRQLPAARHLARFGSVAAADSADRQ